MPSHSRSLTGNTRPRLWRLAKRNDGNVMIEFAFVAPILVVLIINILDFSLLIWAHMEVDYSAQMGGQAAYKTCSTGTLPAKTNCTGLSTAVTTAIQATSLGTGVSLTSGYPSETYYCVSGTTLQSVGSYSSRPSPFNCSAAGDASATPGDYIEVDVTYDYSPTFSGLSLASAQTLTGKSIQRLN
jgi:Flp pilus assembly protein TadG